MNYKKIVFIGNRIYVLKEILAQKNSEKIIFAVRNSYLERYLQAENIPHKVIQSKKILIDELSSIDCDLLVSNGCPFLLPISKLKKQNEVFVNVHPSYLPDMRGIHPVNGAILYGRDIGATCHIMDDFMDSGDIVSQVKIPLTNDLDLGLLYQLCFMAEADAFKIALNNDFKVKKKNIAQVDTLSYKRNIDDMKIKFDEEAEMIVRRAKAFGVQSQGSYFYWRDQKFIVMDAEIVNNPYILAKINEYKNGEVVSLYENTILVKKDSSYVKLKNVQGDLHKIKVGDVLR